MTVQLYNTASRAKQPLVPIDPSNVRLYVCGPTVYDFAHIGNARPVIVFDVLYRLLRHVYGADHVTYVRNITDVDDKINARAVRDFPDIDLNEAIRRVTEGTAAQYQADVTELGNLSPDVQPRATEHLPEMIVLIERLIASNHAYEAEGHVLFHVPSMPDYGKLSGRSVDDMIAGARVDVAPFKRDPMDFVLWKPSDAGQPGWPSPWGVGRPGWHIECSAMSWKHLGEVFDIHGGGIDLVFPHHENELAQSRCAHGTPAMANTWMHNGFLQVEGEKMSKSLGNFFTIRDLLDVWPGAVLRLNMLRTHYRQPIDWTVSALTETKATLDGWYDLVASVTPAAAPPASVLDAIADDLNTPGAIAAMHDLAKKKDYAGLRAAWDFLSLGIYTRADSTFTVAPGNGEAAAQAAAAIGDPALAETLLARIAARNAKDFATSDALRDAILAAQSPRLAIKLSDRKDGDAFVMDVRVSVS
ncbi:MAG: cysteine--tRNA ligase [Micropepsaceae bacterium]